MGSIISTNSIPKILPKRVLDRQEGKKGNHFKTLIYISSIKPIQNRYMVSWVSSSCTFNGIEDVASEEDLEKSRVVEALIVRGFRK